MIVGKTTHFTAATTAAVIRDVRCEKCGCAYRYELVRRGEGMGSAVYGIGEGAAERRADRRARELLEAHLASAVDPVACPDCGWLQAAMVREFRGRHYRWLDAIGTTIRWIAGAVLILLTAEYVSNLMLRPGVKTPIGLWIAVIIFAALLLLGIAIPSLICPALRRAIDPNATYPEMPAPIPGAPRAFRRGEDAAGPPVTVAVTPGLVAVEGVPATVGYERPHPLNPGGWVTVQLLSARYPPMCCSCLRATEYTHTYHPLWSKADVTVPLCHQCADRFWGRRGLCMAGTILLFAAAMTGLGMWWIGSGFLWAGVMVGAGGGWMVADVLTPILIRPVDLRRFSDDRNTIQLRFRNRVYNTAFADENQPAV